MCGCEEEKGGWGGYPEDGKLAALGGLLKLGGRGGLNEAPGIVGAGGAIPGVAVGVGIGSGGLLIIFRAGKGCC